MNNPELSILRYNNRPYISIWLATWLNGFEPPSPVSHSGVQKNTHIYNTKNVTNRYFCICSPELAFVFESSMEIANGILETGP